MERQTQIHAPKWSLAIRLHREAAGLTRDDLALRTGISASAIKAFERGLRHPKESTLAAIVDALGLTREQANPIRNDAGYPEDWYALFHDRYPSSALDLDAAVRDCPWPAFVSNQAIDVIHWNSLFERLMGVDLSRELTGPGERNFLARASDARFHHVFENFDEMVSYIVGLVKGDPRWRQSPATPAPWLERSVGSFLQGDPQIVGRVLELWNTADPIAHGARHSYPVRLRHGDLVLSFRGSTTIADLWNELSWNEWVPEDVDTWHALAELKA